MCVIVVRPPGVNIQNHILQLCFIANDDGAGFMYAANKRLYIEKGFFTFDSFANAYARVPDNVPCVLHFRLATSGLHDWNNCHPHKINRGLAFVHNGIIPTSPIRNRTDSDTVWFNKEVLKKMPSNFHKRLDLVMAIEGMIGPCNKLVVLDRFGCITFFNADGFGEYMGCWFSNFNWSRPLFEPTSRKKLWCPSCSREYSCLASDFNIIQVCNCGSILERAVNEYAYEGDYEYQRMF